MSNVQRCSKGKDACAVIFPSIWDVWQIASKEFRYTGRCKPSFVVATLSLYVVARNFAVCAFLKFSYLSFVLCKFCGLECNVSRVFRKCFYEKGNLRKTLHSVDGFMTFKISPLQTHNINKMFLNTKRNQFLCQIFHLGCSKCFFNKELASNKEELAKFRHTADETVKFQCFQWGKNNLYWN